MSTPIPQFNLKFFKPNGRRKHLAIYGKMGYMEMTDEKIGIVRIHWLDHNSTPGWKPPDDVKPEGYAVESVGWLIDETDDVILLAMSVGESRAADFLCIIKSCITERWEL